MCQSHRLKEDFSDMGSLESSKRQEGLNFHLILPHPGIRGCSAAVGNPFVPSDDLPLKVRSPSTAALQGCIVLQGGRVAGEKNDIFQSCLLPTAWDSSLQLENVMQNHNTEH